MCFGTSSRPTGEVDGNLDPVSTQLKMGRLASIGHSYSMREGAPSHFMTYILLFCEARGGFVEVATFARLLTQD